MKKSKMILLLATVAMFSASASFADAGTATTGESTKVGCNGVNGNDSAKNGQSVQNDDAGKKPATAGQAQ